MASIGSLAVSITAKTKNFSRGIDRAKKKLRSFTSAIPGFNAVFSKTSALISGLAAGGLAAFINSQSQAIDSTAKFADRIGMSTEGLVALQHAAELTGVATNSLQMGLQRMTRRIAEAAQGTGEAKDAIRELGLDAGELSRMKPEQAFAKIADKMKLVATQGDRVRLAMKLFDSEGVALVNTLALGSDGLADMREEAEALGLTFSRLDAFKVEAANDAMSRVGATFKGIGRTLAVELAPMVEAAATSFVEWAKSGEGMGAKVVSAVEAVVGATGTAIDVLNVMKGTFQISASLAVGAFALVTRAIGESVRAAETLVEVLTLGIVESDFGSRMIEFSENIRTSAREMLHSGAASVSAGFSGEAKARFLKGIAEIKSKAQDAASEMDSIARNRQRASEIQPGVPTERELAAAKGIASAYQGIVGLQQTQLDALRDEVEQRELTLRYGDEWVETNEVLLKYLQLYEQGQGELADRLVKIVELEKEAAEAAKLKAEEAKREESVQRQQQASARKLDALKKARSEMKDDLGRELELMRAANEFERERIQLAHELADVIAEHREDEELIAKLKEVHAEKLGEIADREREAARGVTEELREQERLVKKRADITKRFESAPGSGGLFGFGAGQVGFQWSAGRGDMGTRKGRKRTAGTAKKVAAPSDPIEVPELEDLSPIVAAAKEVLAKLPSHWDALGDELRSFTARVIASDEKIGRGAAQMGAELGTKVRELDAIVRRIERDMKNAARVGVGK